MTTVLVQISIFRMRDKDNNIIQYKQQPKQFAVDYRQRQNERNAYTNRSCSHAECICCCYLAAATAAYIAVWLLHG